jgi:hypothetical protein
MSQQGDQEELLLEHVTGMLAARPPAELIERFCNGLAASSIKG